MLLFGKNKYHLISSRYQWGAECRIKCQDSLQCLRWYAKKDNYKIRQYPVVARHFNAGGQSGGGQTHIRHHNFDNAKQVVAFSGLAPAPRESGQWRGNTHIAKNGDSALRKALYMPALVAWRYNPLIRVFCERLKANGKNGKANACAAMRKLIHIAFGVLKSGKPFDPNYAV